MILGGTNALHSRQLLNRQWPLTPRQINSLKHKTVFLGVGWWQYQRPPTRATRRLLRLLSHPDVPHALRDGYTAERVATMGVPSLMTGCPTMWNLHGVSTTLSPGPNTAVVTTLTDYHFDYEVDGAWLRCLRQAYDTILVVGMGPGDEPAFRKLPRLDGVQWAGYGREGLDRARSNTVDYVGTRLHAGVYWLQQGGNSLVVAVDNRATEMGRDTGLPVVAREDLTALAGAITTPRKHEILLPERDIASWRDAWTAYVGS